MKADLKDVEFASPADFTNLNSIINSRPKVTFLHEDIAYLSALSDLLIRDPEINKYPDVATFAFYCRKANLIHLKNKFQLRERIRVGRGIIFHITPSNVPVNFAYSLIAGLLAGNINIVKIPSGDFQQVKIIIRAINELARKKENELTASRVILVRYHRNNSHPTKYFSSICDIRVIWGGDESIGRIRKFALSPRAFDVTFSDRYSLCVIDADSYITERKPLKIAEGFYNDTYLFDQNACTSPHLVIWLGSNQNIKKSRSVFWHSLHAIVKEKYELSPMQSIDKISGFYNQSLSVKNIKKINTKDNLLWRIELENVDSRIEEFRCAGGYFNEYCADSISEIASLVSKKYQTMSYYGISKKELSDFIYLEIPNGIDRVTPIGRTMDFSLNWDGYDLISTLSREVEIT